MVEERTMLLIESCFSDISLTKQKILQRRHFISAGNPVRNSGRFAQPYEFLQEQESRPVYFMKFDSCFRSGCLNFLSLTKSTAGKNPQPSFGRGVSQAAAASAHAYFVLKCDRVAFVG